MPSENPIGRWISEKPYQEGFNLWINFRKDGSVTGSAGVDIPAACTLGNGELTLTMQDNGKSDSLSMHALFSAKDLTVSAIDPTVPSARTHVTHYIRVGTISDAANPQVGRWVQAGSPDTEGGFRFAADGSCSMRVAVGNQDTGHWSSRHDTYTITSPEPLPYRRRGGVLTLTMDMGKRETIRFIPDTF